MQSGSHSSAWTRLVTVVSIIISAALVGSTCSLVGHEESVGGLASKTVDTGAASPAQSDERPPRALESSTSTTATTAPTTSTTTSTTQPPSTATDPRSDAASLEQEVVNLTNAERSAAGCPALRANDQLAAAARAHSADMADRGYFSHSSPDGSTIESRVEAQGYNWRRLAENIAAGYQTPESVVEGWMNSSGHRANIVNCELTEIGVGYDQVHWTQNFGTPAESG